MRMIILGAGGYGRTVADVVAQMGHCSEICFLDDKSTADNVIGKCEEFRKFINPDALFYPAFGNNQFRKQWLDKLEAAGCRIATIIHPTAYCSPMAVIEPGAAIMPRAIINTECRIERGCLINLGALIDHGCIIGECAHICVGAIVKAENRIPGETKIEAGTVVPDRIFPL